jgi:hypothetical protein
MYKFKLTDMKAKLSELKKEKIKAKIADIKEYQQFLKQEIKYHEKKVKGLGKESQRHFTQMQGLYARLRSK